MGTASFPGVKSVRAVMLTLHPLLVPWSRKGRAIPLLPYGPYDLYRSSVPVQGCTLPLPFVCNSAGFLRKDLKVSHPLRLTLWTSKCFSCLQNTQRIPIRKIAMDDCVKNSLFPFMIPGKMKSCSCPRHEGKEGKKRYSSSHSYSRRIWR